MPMQRGPAKRLRAKTARLARKYEVGMIRLETTIRKLGKTAEALHAEVMHIEGDVHKAEATVQRSRRSPSKKLSSRKRP